MIMSVIGNQLEMGHRPIRWSGQQRVLLGDVKQSRHKIAGLLVRRANGVEARVRLSTRFLPGVP